MRGEPFLPTPPQRNMRAPSTPPSEVTPDAFTLRSPAECRHLPGEVGGEGCHECYAFPPRAHPPRDLRVRALHLRFLEGGKGAEGGGNGGRGFDFLGLVRGRGGGGRGVLFSHGVASEGEAAGVGRARSVCATGVLEAVHGRVGVTCCPIAATCHPVAAN